MVMRIKYSDEEKWLCEIQSLIQMSAIVFWKGVMDGSWRSNLNLFLVSSARKPVFSKWNKRLPEGDAQPFSPFMQQVGGKTVTCLARQTGWVFSWSAVRPAVVVEERGRKYKEIHEAWQSLRLWLEQLRRKRTSCMGGLQQTVNEQVIKEVYIWEEAKSFQR